MSEDQAFVEGLRYLQKEVRRTNLPPLKPYFEDFDRHRRGSVSTSQFGRACSQGGLKVPPHVLGLLISRYAVGSGGVSGGGDAGAVDYRSFLFDLANAGQESTANVFPGTISNAGAGSLAVHTQEMTRIIDAASEGTAAAAAAAAAAANVIAAENAAARSHAAIAAQTSARHPMDSSANASRELRLARLLQPMSQRVRRGGISLIPAFRAYDALRRGRIHPARFQAVLDVENLCHLSQADLALLAEEYAHSSDPKKIDYMQFIRDLEQIPSFSPKKKNAQPRHFEDIPQEVLAGVPAPSAADRDLAAVVTDRMRHEVQKTRILIKPFFKSHDRINVGSLTPDKFGRVIALMRLKVTGRELEALCNVYRVASPDSEIRVDYRKFCEILDRPLSPDHSLDDVNELPPDLRLTRKASSPPPPAAQDASDVLHRFKTRVFSERIVVDGLFKDFDRLHTGHVRATQFFRALSAAGFRFSEAEMEVLLEKFRVRGNKAAPGAPQVDWRAFVTEINSVWVTPGLEQHPTQETGEFTPWRQEDDNPVAQSQLDQIRVQEILNRIARFSYQHRVLLKPIFKDRDPINSGCVNGRMFQSLISDFLKVDISQEEFDLLRNFYMRGSRGVSYVRFIKDLSAAEQAADDEYKSNFVRANALRTPARSAAALMATYNGNSGGGGGGGDDNASNVVLSEKEQQLVDDLTLQIAKKVKRLRVRLLDEFRDFDKRRTGKVHVSRFWSVLNTIRVHFSTMNNKMAEKALAKAFACPKASLGEDPSDNMIDLARFQQALIDSVSTRR